MGNVNLPDGWEWKTLGDVSISQSGAGFPRSYQGEAEGDYPFAKVSDITKAVQNNGGSLVSAANYLSSENAKTLHAKIFPAGTTLFAKIGEAVRLNRRAIVSVPVLADNNVMGLIPNIDILLPKFLYHFMHTVDLYEYSQATTVPSVRKSDVEQIALPLPPLPEQERIVSRIEELFSDLEAGVAALERVRAGLKRYKASVLKAAVSGKLVDGNLQVEEGVLPKGWRWVKLGELIRDGPTNGLYLPKSRYGVGIPILRIDDYQNGYSKSSGELRLVDATPNEVEKYGLREGDLIINRVNSPSHLGKCEIISKRNLPAIFESNMMRIRLSLERAEPNYIESYLQSVDGKSRLIRNAKWAVNQASINQQDVVSTLVPLPPLDEQRRIVAEVERRLSVVGEVESAVEAGLVRAGRLRQAVLRSAFEGRL